MIYQCNSRRASMFFALSVFLMLLGANLQAAVTLPAIVSSNMILQRNAEITLWGWAESEEKITIEASWLDIPLNVQADRKGNWRVAVRTTNSKEAQSIRIHSAVSDINLENVLFGEVWLCSGQSNMQQPLKGYVGQPVFGSTMAIAKSYNPNLRLFHVGWAGSNTPETQLKKAAQWEQATPNNVADFSAIAYFFGQQLQEILDVPVGIIHTSRSDSSIQAWISKEALSEYQEVIIDSVAISNNAKRTPTALFNSMIHPLIPYTIKGALWYQGEANRQEPEVYKKLFPAMVKDWRSRWGQGNFPFYYVQIAPYRYEGNDGFQTVDNSAFMREAQLACLDLIPNSGIAITMDLGEKNFIHPPKKKEVADRLLFNALNQTYDFQGLNFSGPIYDSMEITNGGIVLNFENAAMGLYAHNELASFEIAGKDKVFYPAHATLINGNKNVFVESDRIRKAIAVRYAWRNWAVGTLYGTNLLPAASFRTDQWEDATRVKK